MLARSTFALTMLLSSLRGSTGLALNLRRLPRLSPSTRRLSVDPNAAGETSARTKATDSKALGRVTKIKADGSAILEVWAATLTIVRTDVWLHRYCCYHEA